MSEANQARRERRLYDVGFVFSLGLTLAAFGLVTAGALNQNHSAGALVILAIIQALVHFRYFLHIDVSRQKREDLLLIAFTAVLLVLMAGGTVWVLTDLATRMTPPTPSL